MRQSSVFLRGFFLGLTGGAGSFDLGLLLSCGKLASRLSIIVRVEDDASPARRHTPYGGVDYLVYYALLNWPNILHMFFSKPYILSA